MRSSECLENDCLGAEAIFLFSKKLCEKVCKKYEKSGKITSLFHVSLLESRGVVGGLIFYKQYR